MAYLTGILLDVSASMSLNINRNSQGEMAPWAKSIFSVMDNLVKHDLSTENQTFVIAFGTSAGNGILDVLKTVKIHRKIITRFQAKNSYAVEHISHQEAVEKSLELLTHNGAPFIRKWATTKLIMDATCPREAILEYAWLKTDRGFLNRFVADCLPDACKSPDNTLLGINFNNIIPGLGWVLENTKGQACNAYIGVTGKRAEIDDIMEVFTQAKALMLEGVSEGTVFSVSEASSILHGGEGNSLTNERQEELLESVEPFIYGRTPFYSALQNAASLFTKSNHKEKEKLLFILSDGDPTDAKNQSPTHLREAGVTIVCCYITNNHIANPRRLYSVEEEDWDDSAKLMFRLSTAIPTQSLPSNVFIRKGWIVDVTNNETKLFVQVNHPALINEVCDLAKDVVCSHDALSNVLSTVSLDLYINKCNSKFEAKKQRGGTCYANASAAVLHLAMKRIVSRDGGYPGFFALRDEMIQQYGKHGANTRCVLEEVCPRYRLQFRSVDNNGALKAVAYKRPVVARFRLTEQEWDIFSAFFGDNPKGIISANEIDISARQPGQSTSGHAVVLTSFNSQCLHLMNSWGTNWADKGFFRVKNAAVLGLEFFDVFWTLQNLSQQEKDNYDTHGSEVARKLITSLRGLQTAEYKCPLCQKSSLVSEFRGRLVEAQCPNARCRGWFNCGEAGNILALNMYLTSIMN